MLKEILEPTYTGEMMLLKLGGLISLEDLMCDSVVWFGIFEMRDI